jgi:hypothetical protein
LNFGLEERMVGSYEQIEPLWRKDVKCYENCPGYKVKKHKEKKKGYSLKEGIQTKI